MRTHLSKIEDYPAFLDGKLGDVSVPDWNIRKVQLESLDSMVVPFDCEQFTVSGHAVSK